MVTSPLVPGWKIAPIMSDLRVSHGDRVAVGIAVSGPDLSGKWIAAAVSMMNAVKGWRGRWEVWSSSSTTWETGVGLFVND